MRALQPLGVGINIQPNAVRELFDLGIAAENMDAVGVPAREWALVGQHGQDIYAEPRGKEAGYHWPQYAAHRGKLHMMLYDTLIARAGTDAVRLGAKVTGYYQERRWPCQRAGRPTRTAPAATETGTLLIGADGIHSAIRAQMHPDQPPIHWGGALMWRGTTRAEPIRTGSSFVGLGTHRQRMVIYPISQTDADGHCRYQLDRRSHRRRHRGSQKPAGSSPQRSTDFIHHFDGWTYDWLDVPPC